MSGFCGERQDTLDAKAGAKPFKSKNRDKIDLDVTNLKVVIEILERQPNLSYYVLIFAGEILFELSRNFNLTNPHNSL